jgi:ABC-type transporter Mla subunit MlaD
MLKLLQHLWPIVSYPLTAILDYHNLKRTCAALSRSLTQTNELLMQSNADLQTALAEVDRLRRIVNDQPRKRE